MDWPLCLSAITWLLDSINAMSVKCVLRDPQAGAGYGGGQGPPCCPGGEMESSLSSHQGQEACLLHGSSLSYCPGGFLGEQSGVVDRGQAPCLSSLSLCPFLRAPAPDVVALFHAPLYLISRTMTRFGDLRAQMDCLLALSGA